MQAWVRPAAELTGGRLARVQGMQGSIDKAEEVVARTQGAFMLQQFESAANPEIHYKTTGPEIWRDTAGTVDFLVAGAINNFCFLAAPDSASCGARSSKPAVWPLTHALACLRAHSHTPACNRVGLRVLHMRR